MNSPFQSVRDIESGREILRQRPYGTIESANGQLVQIKLKPWPKIASIVEAKWISGWRNRRRPMDICRLYYNQPILHRNYLALTFIESTIHTRPRTVFNALEVLDQIAYIKGSDAILAELSNDRISNRLMTRLGWERHLDQDQRRHWIKRFYGEFPSHSVAAASITSR